MVGDWAMGDVVKTYLGDGAYAEVGGHDVKIFTSDGYKETNVIYLGPREIEILVMLVSAKWGMSFEKPKE